MTIKTTMAKIDKLNPYAYRIETAQTQVRDVIKQAFLWRKDFDETTSELTRVIHTAASDLDIETLKRDCAISAFRWRATADTPARRRRIRRLAG